MSTNHRAIRQYVIERDPHQNGLRAGDDWVIRAYENGRERMHACWYGSRSEALKDLRRKFNGHGGRIL